MTTVLTGYTEEYEPLGSLTASKWQAYADAQGYRFKLVRDYPPPKHPCTHKLRHIAEALPSCDMLFWVGADCLPTNPSIPLPVSLGKYEIALSRDWYEGAKLGSTDAILVRNTPAMLALFKEAYALPQQERIGGYDLTALATMFERNPEYAKRLVILPARRFQAVPRDCGFTNNPDPWQPGDFVLHATGVPMEQRIQIIKKYR